MIYVTFLGSDTLTVGDSHGEVKHLFLQRRVDYFLVSDSLRNDRYYFLNSIRSFSHNIKLRPTCEGNRGLSYWKFNSLLTEDRQFVNSLKNEIPVFEKEVFVLTDPIMK